MVHSQYKIKSNTTIHYICSQAKAFLRNANTPQIKVIDWRRQIIVWGRSKNEISWRRLRQTLSDVSWPDITFKKLTFQSFDLRHLLLMKSSRSKCRLFLTVQKDRQFADSSSGIRSRFALIVQYALKSCYESCTLKLLSCYSFNSHYADNSSNLRFAPVLQPLVMLPGNPSPRLFLARILNSIWLEGVKLLTT